MRKKLLNHLDPIGTFTANVSYKGEIKSKKLKTFPESDIYAIPRENSGCVLGHKLLYSK